MRSRLATAGGTFALQVRGAADLGAAINALKLARVDLLGLASATGTRSATPAPSVSSVVNSPDGPLFLVEGLDADDDLRRTIPEVVVRRLERAGIESATVDVPVRGGLLDQLDSVPWAVVLRLFPRVRGGPVRTNIPPDWLDVAGEWVAGDLSSDDVARVRVLGVEFDLPSRDVPAALHECGLANAWCDAVHGEFDDRIRVASVTFGRLPHLALATGGPNVGDPGLLARFQLLKEVARELAADLAYGCIDFEPTFEGLALGLSPEGWQTQGGAPPNTVARELLDDRVPDAYPYQVLNPGHVARLGDIRVSHESLGDGRIEITLEDPAIWLPGAASRDDAQAVGWEVLAPCLVTAEELDALVEANQRADTADASGAIDVEVGAFDSLPDLDDLVLERSAHQRRGTKLTLLELVSWLNHEPHSDSPASVSPVLATYARWLAAGFDHPDRQALKAIAPRLIGTAPASAAEERARQWRATEWLVRVHAPAWLRAAGLLEAAERLESLGHLTDDLELVRAVDVLGTAIMIGSRRLDITASIVSEKEHRGSVPDEEIVWNAWERVTETTGYVAASEAATHGALAELTYATDLRVIECSRDPRVRDELDEAHQSIGDAAWTAALHAVADEAWENAWRAADLAAKELSGFTASVDMSRMAKSVLVSAHDDDDRESTLEVADQAARDSLTRAALAGGAVGGEHPWDAARNAARVSAGGKEWSVLSDEARRSIGETAWAQAMADARAVVTEVLTDAPDNVARVVVAAVSREASSVAARGIALRATAVARAQGGGVRQAEAAAEDALQRVAIGLQASALSLLDAMIDVDVDVSVTR